MAKDGTTIILGIIYCAIVGLCWIFMCFPYYSYFLGPYFVSTPGGIFAFLGNLVLIPSFIMYMIFFCSTEGSTSASVGFGLGIAGWVLGMTGQILEMLFGYFSSFLVIEMLIFYISLTVFGSILFARRHNWELPLAASRETPSSSPITPPTSPSSPTIPGPPCSKCNRATRFIAEYNRYYCDQCQQYV
ncbi:MAG TPA: hypothetical protein VMV49_02830 [Candidatus Deferrimicrobium sp.]|nr:hypothetical protein [Candidatus Deferrimicrobium sp.]